MQQAQISDGRKVAYYGGMAMMILGAVLFISCFFSAYSLGKSTFNSFREPVISVSPGAPPGMEGAVRSLLNLPPKSKPHASMSQIMIRGFIGMGLVFVGGILMGVGQRGLAGSGIVLDPNQARDDLKPWSQMAGGMLDDALSQSETVSKITHQKEEVIKIKCQKCGALNDEDAKYCDECGTKI